MSKARTLLELFRRDRRPGDLVFSVLFLVFSVFMVVSLPGETTWASGTRLLAQPAFWPYVAVISMTLFAVLHLISSLLSPAPAGRWAEIRFWLRSFEFVGWFIAYVMTVPRVGYLPSTILFTVVLAFRLGYRGPKSLGLAALFAVTVVVIFKSLLQVKVPGGQLYEYLPPSIQSFMLTYF